MASVQDAFKMQLEHGYKTTTWAIQLNTKNYLTSLIAFGEKKYKKISLDLSLS